jgi:hypothetical protein
VGDTGLEEREQVAEDSARRRHLAPVLGDVVRQREEVAEELVGAVDQVDVQVLFLPV